MRNIGTHVRNGGVYVRHAVRRAVRIFGRMSEGGATWAEAELSDPLPAATGVDETPSDDTVRDAWRMWRYEYDKRERHEVVVRAYERDGTHQPRDEFEPFPTGATGWVSEVVYENRE